MSSTLEQAVSDIQLNDYGSLIMLVAVGYDYTLTFPDEIEYIWNKPWTMMSSLFVLVRYFGLCALICCSIFGSSFLPGPAMEHRQGEIVCLLSSWTTVIFIAAADLMMILRVWAMYSRSKFILGFLLTLYVAEVVPFLVTCVILSTPNVLIAAPIQVLDFSVCALAQNSAFRWSQTVDALQLVLNASLCFLVTIQFLRQSFRMYRVTRRWELGRYMNLLAREGVLYFLAILAFALINELSLASYIPTGGVLYNLITITQYVPVFTLAPRLILNVRAMYARDLRGLHTSNAHMDTDFGLNATPSQSRGGRTSSVMFNNEQMADVLRDGDGLGMGQVEMGEADIQGG